MAEGVARERGVRELIVHAQRASQDFYEGCRFVAEGETFSEDGIDHVRMRKTIVHD
jgi:predicted GNAT family N-acyltransferase